ncbi:MAG: hypothetical protein HZB43_12235 [candidate division Zixibacteria bacterium]|nr:hypothetical protein [candidate division Zixibacteria bacterium]
MNQLSTLSTWSTKSTPSAKAMPKFSLRTIGSILAALTAALTAYYSTVYGIRLTVNEKADRATVEQIDRRLVEIETVINHVDTRLNRIETLLIEAKK